MTASARSALVLGVLSVVLQLAALSGLVQPVDDAHWLIFGGVEMLLIVLLLANGGRIMGEVTSTTAKNIAGWCFVGLLLCSVGDLVNRNFSGEYFRHGNLIAHDYLADSVWFFLPGYCCLIYAAFLAVSRIGLSLRIIALTATAFAVTGALSFASMYTPEAGLYILSLTASYAVLISICGAAALWLVLGYGWRRMGLVALGFALALVADGLIGQFWLYGDGHYPFIRHINWIIYFSSQALIQQLPSTVQRLENDEASVGTSL